MADVSAPAPVATMAACALCGRPAPDSRPTPRHLVAVRYRPGPFAWPTAVQGPTECCDLCLNHIRKRRRPRPPHLRPYLPMDQFLLGLLCPGHVPRVDRRCERRLWAALAHGGNPYRRTGAAPLEALLQAERPVAAWWDLNLRTLFFRHQGTAQAVRRALRPDPP